MTVLIGCIFYIAMLATIQPTFDYAALDPETRIVVQQEEKEFDRNIGEAGGSFIHACHNVKRIHDCLRYKRPGFVDWFGSRGGLAKSTAYRMVEVAGMFPESGNIGIHSKEALYLLASPSTPDDVREQFIEAAQNGEPVTHADVKAAMRKAPETPAEVAAQNAADNAMDPLLLKYGSDGQQPTLKADPEPDADVFIGNAFTVPEKTGKPAEPETWNGRVIPAGAPDLNLDEAVRNDPGVRWTRLIAKLQDCVLMLPGKDTLATLPKEKSKYIRDRMRTFAQTFKESI